MLGTAPADYRTSFDLAAEAGLLEPALRDPLRPSVGLRNVLAHEYVDIDLAVVSDSATRAIDDYRDYVRAVSQWMIRDR